MFAGFALTLLAAGSGRVSPGMGPPPLQPKTYDSPSGEWSLEVDPTQRYGAGAGDYRATRAGEPVWAKRLPFTLYDARIDDSGRVAGYGFDQGGDGSDSECDFRIAVLSASGEPLSDRAWPMTWSRALEGGRLPWVNDVVHDPALGSVVFLLEAEDEGGERYEEWRSVDLESGRLLEDFRADQRAEFPPERRASVLDLLPVPGTGLYAVAWRTSIDPYDAGAHDLCATLVRPDGRKVGELNLPQALDVFGGTSPSYSWNEIQSIGPLLPSQEAERFSLWLPRLAQRVEYSVKRLPGDEQWLIEELGREPFEPEIKPSVEDPPSEAVELPLLARVEMEASSSAPSGEGREAVVALQYPWSAAIDLLGRIAIFDAGAFALHVFDSTGQALFVASSIPGDFGPNYGDGEIVGALDGTLCVRSAVLEGGWLQFDTEGKRVGPASLGESWKYFMDDLAFALESGHYWLHGPRDPATAMRDRESAVLRDNEQRELARIERRADRRWFERLDALATAPSGGVAVLEILPWSAPLKGWSGGAAVSWFEEGGRPIDQFVLSNTHTLHTIAYCGQWIAAASYDVEGVWLCATSNKSLKRFVPPKEWSAGTSGALGFSPDGRELWLVQPSQRVLWRYALP